MASYCTHCKKNWSRLRVIDDGFAEYEYCPICLTDSYLVEAKAEPMFSLAIDGRLLNDKGEAVRPASFTKNKLPPAKHSPSPSADYEKQYQHFQNQQERHIAEYQEIYQREGQAAAEQFYFNQKLELQ